MTTSEKIKAIIAETLEISPEAVTDTLAIGEIPQWDSMGNMAIISAIEERLGIEFPLENLFELNSVEAIVKEADSLI